MAFFCDCFSVIRSVFHRFLSDRQQYHLVRDERSNNSSSTEFRFAGWNPETIEAYRSNISRFSSTVRNTSDYYYDRYSQSSENGRNSMLSSSEQCCFSGYQRQQSFNFPRSFYRPPVSKIDASSCQSTTLTAVSKEVCKETIADCSSDNPNPSSQPSRNKAASLLERYAASTPIMEKHTQSLLNVAASSSLKQPVASTKELDFPVPAVDLLSRLKNYTETTKNTFPSPADLPAQSEKILQNSEELHSLSKNEFSKKLLKNPHIYLDSSHVSIVPVKIDHNWMKKREFAIKGKDLRTPPLKLLPEWSKNSTDSSTVFPTQKLNTSYIWTPKMASPASSTNKDLPSLQLNSTLTKKKLYPLPSDLPTQNSKTNYVSIMNEASSIFEVPEYLKKQFERSILPKVLKRSLTPKTYIQYFTTLLHAEDFYAEKWSHFILKGVTLKLQKASVYTQQTKQKNKSMNTHFYNEDGHRVFVKFNIDAVPEKRPYLLSRDFIFLNPVSYSRPEPFQGIIHRVVKSTNVLSEFGPDFFKVHDPSHTYDVSFSFNRVCLKRCHHALKSISPHFSRTLLFPEAPILPPITPKTTPKDAVFARIQRTDTALPPYLIAGTLSSVDRAEKLTQTGNLIRSAILRIHGSREDTRVLIVAHSNKNCDILMRSLVPGVPESEMFRANAAFREYEMVPEDMLSMCLYEGECFGFPSLPELKKFKVVSSTPISSTRIWSVGIRSDHFTHIFVVDCSYMMEPEAVVPLVAFAGEKTVVVVSGLCSGSTCWVRSDVGRRCGLNVSYFERLLSMGLYESMNPSYISFVNDDL